MTPNHSLAMMKYSSLSKRRSRGYSMDSVRLFAGSCIFIIVCGNLVMLQSYHTFVDRHANEDHVFESQASIHNNQKLDRSKRYTHRDILSEYAHEFLPSIPVIGNGAQYSGTEGGRIRKLMQENSKDSFIKRMVVTKSSRFPERFREFLMEPMDMFTCVDVERLENVHHVGSGWTKAVYKGQLYGRSVAVKTVDTSGRSFSECLGKGMNMTICYQAAAHKIVKEIVVLQALSHEHVLKVLGHCVPDKPFDGDADTTVAMVTELGEPIDQIKLLQMSWEDRLRVSYDITRLIAYLSKSPYGSVSLNDFRRTQFVLVNGTLKLSDVDDAGFGEPRCQTDSDCIIDMGRSNTFKRLPCRKGHCQGHNENMNILMTGRYFTSFLLPYGAPKSLRPLVNRIVDHFDNLTSNARGLVRDLEKVINMYKSGAYLGRPKNVKTEFTFHSHSDFPGQFDYRCRFSMTGGSCTMAVFDVQEAEGLCNRDKECQGFVWSHRKTWTGRTLVHFKNGVGIPSPNQNTDLYIKPS